MSDNHKQTVIEDGTVLDGNIISKCGVTVRGRVKGDLQAPSLTVSDSGSVKGQVMVNDLHSQGELSGEIEAETVQLSGKISDNTVIRAKSLQVTVSNPDGGMQVRFGNCQLKVGERFGKGQKAHKKGDQHNKTDQHNKAEQHKKGHQGGHPAHDDEPQGEPQSTL